MTVDIDGTMMCDCCNFEGCGLFCVHQEKVVTAVRDAIGVDFKGFTHHDIAAHYLRGYMHLAYHASTPNKIETCTITY